MDTLPIYNNAQSARRLVVFTGARADWGLLRGLSIRLASRPDIELTVAAGNMHLDPRYGDTASEIRAAGFEPVMLEMNPNPASERARVDAMAQAMTSAAAMLEARRPDAVIILGDRFEALAVATACMMMRVDIIHLHGGEVTLGAIDNSIRHAITQMSALHLVSTEAYARRVIRMGAPRERVIVTGAPGAAVFDGFQPMPEAEVDTRCGLHVDDRTLLVTYHPVTLHPADAEEKIKALCRAMDSIKGLKAVITAPNNDEGGDAIRAAWERYVGGRADRSLHASLGQKCYLSAMLRCGAVVGNSSSGIIEAPSAGVPTLNIGLRQEGRIAARSVVNCLADLSPDVILRALRRTLSARQRAIAAARVNPYYKPSTLALQERAIIDYLDNR